MIRKNIMTLGMLIVLCISNVNASSSDESELLDCDVGCDKTFSQLKKYASHGSPDAQTLLALTYKNGDGIIADETQAWRWIRRAHRQDFPPALHIVSKWYRQGYATEIDISQANEFLERSAEKSFGPAILDLGVLSYQQNDDQKAKELIMKAAQMGSLKAKELLNVFDQIGNTRTKETGISNSENREESDEKLLEDENKGEVMTIFANKEEPIVLLNNMIFSIKESGLYDNVGTTGSRASDRKCGDSNSLCKMISGEEARRALMMFQMENSNK